MGKTQILGSLVNTIFTDSSNNVGIGGAANASFKLQVTGATNLTGALTLGSTINNGTYSYTLPSATGTLALTSQIPSLSGYIQGSGTTNYIPKFTASGTIGNSLIYDTGTRIAIGGTSATDGVLTVQSDAGQFCIQSNTTPGKQLQIGYDHVSNNSYLSSLNQGVAFTPLALQPNGGLVGIGTATPTSISGYGGLTINGTNGAYTYWNINGTDTGRIITDSASMYFDNVSTGALVFRTTSGSSERMRITSGGNVGIGTSSPTHNLEIKNASGSVYQKLNADFGIAYIGMETFDDSFRFVTAQATPIQFYTENTERMRITSGGNVGIFNTLYGINNVRSDGGYGGIDFTNTGVGYQYSAKIYTFKSSAGVGEFYGFTNDYGAGTGGQLSIIAKGDGSANIGFYSGTGSERMRITGSGAILTPSNPAFRAYYSTNATWTLASLEPFVFNATEYNIGGCYNTSNGRFTASVAGIYQFNFYAIAYGPYTNAAIALQKNGGAATSGFNVHFTNTNTAWDNVVYSTSMYLNAGDYITINNISATSINYHGDDWSSFSGYLVG